MAPVLCPLDLNGDTFSNLQGIWLHRLLSPAGEGWQGAESCERPSLVWMALAHYHTYMRASEPRLSHPGPVQRLRGAKPRTPGWVGYHQPYLPHTAHLERQHGVQTDHGQIPALL